MALVFITPLREMAARMVFKQNFSDNCGGCRNDFWQYFFHSGWIVLMFPVGQLLDQMLSNKKDPDLPIVKPLEPSYNGDHYLFCSPPLRRVRVRLDRKIPHHPCREPRKRPHVTDPAQCPVVPS